MKSKKITVSFIVHFCLGKYVVYIYILDTYRRNDNRHSNKGHMKTSLEKYLPLTLLQGFEKGCSRFACERVLETKHKLHILTPLLWPSRCVFLVLLDAQPEVLRSTPSGLFRGPPRSDVAFPTTSGLYCLELCWQLLWHPTQLNYITIQRPHDHPLDPQNRMFNRHQAEITVMQFRVLFRCITVVAQWDLHLVPYHKP